MIHWNLVIGRYLIPFFYFEVGLTGSPVKPCVSHVRTHHSGHYTDVTQGKGTDYHRG